MTGEGPPPPPCEQFTVLDWRPSQDLVLCDVCNHPEAAHATPGRRALAGGEIEELRKRLIIEMYDKIEEEHARGAGNGATDRPQS